MLAGEPFLFTKSFFKKGDTFFCNGFWVRAVIENFDGDVSLVINRTEGIDDGAVLNFSSSWSPQVRIIGMEMSNVFTAFGDYLRYGFLFITHCLNVEMKSASWAVDFINEFNCFFCRV